MLFEQLHPNWQALLAAQRWLLEGIEAVLDTRADVIPDRERVMAAFADSPETRRVLIVGQDPYPNPAHATGFAFAVPPGTHPLPPTLSNIIRELVSDLDDLAVSDPSPPITENAFLSSEKTPDLAKWAEQGVMLLNRHLTTRAGESGAHFGLGWKSFTDAAVSALAALHGRNLVAILWGKTAQQIEPLLGQAEIIRSPHPSPLSSYRGFFGSRPFTRANDALERRGLGRIDWSLNA